MVLPEVASISPLSTQRPYLVFKSWCFAIICTGLCCGKGEGSLSFPVLPRWVRLKNRSSASSRGVGWGVRLGLWEAREKWGTGGKGRSLREASAHGRFGFCPQPPFACGVRRGASGAAAA